MKRTDRKKNNFTLQVVLVQINNVERSLFTITSASVLLLSYDSCCTLRMTNVLLLMANNKYE